MNTLTSTKDVRHLPLGTQLIIYERFGQPHIERLILKSFTPSGFIAAPIDNLNAERSYKLDKTTFKPSQAGFALTSPLGRVAVRFEVKPPQQ